MCALSTGISVQHGDHLNTGCCAPCSHNSHEASWSSGMIRPLGGRGLGFDSRSGPFEMEIMANIIFAFFLKKKDEFRNGRLTTCRSTAVDEAALLDSKQQVVQLQGAGKWNLHPLSLSRSAFSPWVSNKNTNRELSQMLRVKSNRDSSFFEGKPFTHDVPYLSIPTIYSDRHQSTVSISFDTIDCALSLLHGTAVYQYRIRSLCIALPAAQ